MSNLRADLPVAEGGTPSPAGRRWPLLSWPMIAAVTAALVVVALLLALPRWVGSDGPPPRPGAFGSAVSISVERFATRDSLLFASWNSQAFADSLVARLANVRGLEARVEGSGTPADFTLRGDVTRRDGRLVITTRLGRARDDKSIVWSTTYWRGENPAAALAAEIAAEVAEAVYAELVRIDLASRPRR